MTTQQRLTPSPPTPSHGGSSDALKARLTKAISNAKANISAASVALAEIEEGRFFEAPTPHLAHPQSAVASVNFESLSNEIDEALLFDELTINGPAIQASE